MSDTTLSELVTRFDDHCATEKDERDEARTSRKEIMDTLRGTTKAPGVLERLRQLERVALELRSVKRWGVLAVLGLFGKFAWDIFSAWAASQAPSP